MLHGMIDTARRAYASVRRMAGNVLFERPAGIDTASIVRLHELGLKADNRIDYHPTPWLAFSAVSTSPRNRWVCVRSVNTRLIR